MLKMKQDEAICTQFAHNAYRFATERFEQSKLAEYILEDRKRLLEKVEK
jgi:hypothetical protein